MWLDCVYARFYKSFNFDSVRKSHPDSGGCAWEYIDGEFFPYVAVPIDRNITAIVGANESGKSHLLSAIRQAVDPSTIAQRDLCRYSPFFNVEKGKTVWPHLGLKWSDVTPEEIEQIRALTSDAPMKFDSFHMFREGPDVLRLFFPQRVGDPLEARLEGKKARAFGGNFLPRPFDIKPDIALPNAVPLAWLREEVGASSVLNSRRGRHALLKAGQLAIDAIRGEPQQWMTTVATNLFGQFSDLRDSAQSAAAEVEDTRPLALARDLLVKLANVDPDRLSDLAEAIADGADGHANALVTRINDQLGKHLNFPRYWVQDRDFSLKVSPRDVDLVFTIQDRTGTEYVFAERSEGLKYFLSYLIQAQTHERLADRREILLMDEPDTYLSAEAQQDLLKIFDGFAFPDDCVQPIQVVYVTHSPFLLDKNHSERIRVLQKGKSGEGTRVVRNASQNHYEPLRSAFGAFVGETAFIGSCNLLVEGSADQILLAGVSQLIKRDGISPAGDSLDLNRIVIVPCGSASQMPYMLTIVRGRDAEKPPVIALLDSDVEGLRTAGDLRGAKPGMARLIRKEFVLDIGEIFDEPFAGGPNGGTRPLEIEDLLPPGLGVRAANAYFKELNELRGDDIIELNAGELPDRYGDDHSLFDALNVLARKKGSHIDKVGFARAVLRVSREQTDSDVHTFLERMRHLFQALSDKQRRAEYEASKERVSTIVRRLQRNFQRDHEEGATGEQVRNLFEIVEESLDESREADAIRNAMLQLRKIHAVDENLTSPVPNFAELRIALEGLHHSFEHAQGVGVEGQPGGARAPVAKAAKPAEKRVEKPGRDKRGTTGPRPTRATSKARAAKAADQTGSLKRPAGRAKQAAQTDKADAATAKRDEPQTGV